MVDQRIIWTALPNGLGVSDDNQKQLKLSVFVSPRLSVSGGSADTYLAKFPDFSGNWVERVRTIAFGVTFQNGETVPADLDVSNLDSKLWDRLFNEKTYVRSFEFRDLSKRSIRTYPIKGVMSYLRDKYTEIAEKSPDKLPLLEPERDDDGKPIGDPGATLDGFIETTGNVLTPEKEILCEMSEEYGAFQEAVGGEDQSEEEKQKGKYYLLQYIRACLKQNKKILLSDKAEVEVVSDLIWKIIDGDDEYFVEDTGSSLVVYRYGDIYQGIDTILKLDKVLDPSKLYGHTKEQLDFLQANRFYERREDKKEFHLKPNARHVEPSPELEKIDFHQMLAMLGDHPLLMKKLGIVLELTVSPIPDHPVQSIQIVPKCSGENSCPVTFCVLKDDLFIAKPSASGNLVNGMLNLKGADDELSGGSLEYGLMQIDPDGSSLKSLRAGSSMVRQFKRKYRTTFSSDDAKKLLRHGCDLETEELTSFFKKTMGPQHQLSSNAKVSVINGKTWMVSDKGKQYEIVKTPGSTLHVYEKKTTSFDTPEDSGLPALRTAGIGVFKSGRAYTLSGRLVANKTTEKSLYSAGDTKLYADDLLRGYRVDVFDENIPGANEWRSLCMRTGKYYIGEDALNPSPDADSIEVADEGYVKGASATSKDAKDSDLYLNEMVFRWDGWSMVAQRPGKTILPVPGERDVYLFNWNDLPGNTSELISFLKGTFHARWVEKATITQPDADTIRLDNGAKYIELTITNEDVTLRTDTGRKYLYTVKNENGDRNVYNTIPTQDEKVEPTVNKAETEFELASVFEAAPESLPMLRFGHKYRVRARSVDIAGNSISLESNDDTTASESILFSRFEPLIPPTLVPRKRFTEGEAVEHLVIRSNFDQTAKEYISSKDVTEALEGEIHTYDEGSERHVVPPKTSQLIAETHGEFDQYFGPGKNYEEGYNIALKEEGTIADTEIVNINTGEKEEVPDADKIETIIPSHDAGIPEAEVPGQYLVHGEEQLLVPYLPDPVARGTVFRDLPDIISSGSLPLEEIIDSAMGLELLKVPFDMEWPHSMPFRIRIEEKPGHMKDDRCDQSFDHTDDPPQWDDEKRLLTVYLGKGDIRKIKYSCFFNEDDLEKMGIWKWLRSSLDYSTLEKYALYGTHWMMTPYREVTLVHAVQQPLCEPTLPQLDGIKHSIGDTMAEISGELYLSSKSSDKVNLLAYWTEPVDEGVDAPPPHTKDVHSNAFELKIASSFENKVKFPFTPCVAHNHEFGDTKYRRVQYYLNGTSRFREYFHSSIAGTGDEPQDALHKWCFDWENIPGTDDQAILEFLKHIRRVSNIEAATISKSSDGSTITIVENGNSLSLERNTDQNGLIMTVPGNGSYVFPLTVEAENNFCLSADKISRQGPVIEADILNSARPLAPKVQYILPTFGWEQKTDNNRDRGWKSFQRTRKGGGLRVYLDRPWYSSGDGELLGVSLYPHLVPDELKSFVTQWGMDPIRKSKIPKGGLNIGDFENVEHSNQNLSLAELEGYKVNVAGFNVEYSPDRNLWYSDIQLDPTIMTSYYPFIRLALARYQPNSITNAHLSNVVLTDFVQVANDRTLTITRNEKKQEMEISVTGRATGDKASNRMEVVIESLAQGANPELDWKPIDGSVRQPNPYTLKISAVDEPAHLWKWEGKLKIPSRNLDRERPTHNYRLVVREFEKFEADANLDSTWMSLTVYGASQFVTDAERMVYVDIVEW